MRVVLLFILLVYGASLSGCAHRTAPAALTSVEPVDTIWYISARARENGRATRRFADSLEFGFVVSHLEGDGARLTSNFDTTPIDSTPLSRAAFVSALRRRAYDASADDSLAVLYVHGFGTSLHEAWDFATQAHVRAQSRAPWVVFCWPSNGAGVAWPRPNQILVRAYHEDSVMAAASRAAFSEAVQLVTSAISSSHLVLLAHSLGSQIVAEELVHDTTLRRLFASKPLRALAFFAPDIETGHFNDVVAPAVMPLAQRVVTYASSNDRMLSISRRVNKSERAGLIRSPTRPASGVETVDATEGSSSEGRMQRIVGSHHAFRRASASLFDLLHVVARGYAATCRESLGMAVHDSLGLWRLTDRAVPLPSATAVCSR